ncbi:kinesin-like protein Klp59C [Drosophila madeirensis]|uniref:Kinesin-like protein Klp59C n=1 Tax=Drosophila madeirensis TaxID=30013 RepID=A0AAU9FF37_DROMD
MRDIHSLLSLEIDVASARVAGIHKGQRHYGLYAEARHQPKGPLADREVDVIRVQPPNMLVAHAPRHHVYLERTLNHQNFCFDRIFDEDCTNASVHNFSARPLIRHIFEGG